MTQPETTPRYLLLGEILRPHGVRGEMRLKILTDYPERIADIETVYIGQGSQDEYARPYRVESARFHKKYLLLKVQELPDRDAVEPFRGLYVMIDVENAVPLEDDEIYLYELIGLTVQTDDGDTLGNISDVLETGANDVYIVNSPRYGEILVPAHDETLLDVNLEEKTVTMQLPDGLLPD
jgi:16S rRNA processing protein RimM